MGKPVSTSQLKYILLMRHAEYETLADSRPSTGVPARQSGPLQGDFIALLIFLCRRRAKNLTRLTEKGSQASTEVAKSLAGFARTGFENLTLAAVIPANTPEAKATAEVVAALLGLRVHAPLSLLNPIIVSQISGSSAEKAEILRKAVEKRAGEMANATGNAVLFIGHQPLLGWMVHSFLKDGYPIAHSEVLCLGRGLKGKWHLKWSISPSDPEATRALMDKIKSKMEVAKLLSAFIAAGLGFLLPTMADTAKLDHLKVQRYNVEAGALFLFVSFLLYLGTMCSYDALMMPVRFWAEAPLSWDRRPDWLVSRPPSSAHSILYQNMIRIWTRQFIPATCCLMIGLLLLLAAVAGPPDHPYMTAGAVSELVFVCYLLRQKLRLSARRNFGPWLGWED